MNQLPVLLLLLFVSFTVVQPAPIASGMSKRVLRGKLWHPWVCGCLSSPDMKSADCHRFRWTNCTDEPDASCKINIEVKRIEKNECNRSEIISSWSSPEGGMYLQIIGWMSGPSTYRISRLIKVVNNTLHYNGSLFVSNAPDWTLRAVQVANKSAMLRRVQTKTLTSATTTTTNRTTTTTTANDSTVKSTLVSSIGKLISNASTADTNSNQGGQRGNETKTHLRLYPRECGKRDPFSFTIIGGGPATEYSWPWHVAFTTETDTECRPGAKRNTFCGGTLIHPWFVLTAAHCVKHSNFMMVIGDYDREDCRGREQYVSPAQIIRYSTGRNALRHDIALVQLSRPIANVNATEYACIPPAGFTLPPGTNCMIYGWGKTSETAKELSNIINEADITIGYPESCHPRANETQICAGMMRTRTDSCHGDSGGGLMCQVPPNYEVVKELSESERSDNYYVENEDYESAPDVSDDQPWILYGITSMGRGCGREPGIYQSVPAYSEWILQTIAEFENRHFDDASARRRT